MRRRRTMTARKKKKASQNCTWALWKKLLLWRWKVDLQSPQWKFWLFSMAKENKKKKVRSKIGQFVFCKQWKLGWTQVTKVQKSFALGKSMIWQFVVRKQWKKRKLNIRWSVGVCQVCQHLVTLNYKNHKSWNSGHSFLFLQQVVSKPISIN